MDTLTLPAMSLADSSLSVLTMQAGDRVCAAPLGPVVEVMRPLPVEPLAGAPRFVCGLAIIRGEPTPVVDLRLLLDENAVSETSDATRFVTLRIGARRVALRVERVLAIRTLAGGQLAALPPLWQGPHSPAVAALGALDRELLIVLETARLFPDDTGSRDGEGASS